MRVKIIEDSIGPHGIRLTTAQTSYWRGIHPEVMTHRALCRNASSSRAIPIETMLKQVEEDPFIPAHWGLNQKGMQTGPEVDEAKAREAEAWWKLARHEAVNCARALASLGIHKSLANRLTEPFQRIHVVLTGTSQAGLGQPGLENFFALRTHEAAEKHFQDLANALLAAMNASTPVSRPYLNNHGDAQLSLHLPYITAEERETTGAGLLQMASAARCARVSYLKHDGTATNLKEDLDLYRRLVGDIPRHASPTEHQASVAAAHHRSGPLVGWSQLRKRLTDECLYEFKGLSRKEYRNG